MYSAARTSTPRPSLTLVEQPFVPQLRAVESELAQLPPPKPEPIVTHAGCEPLPHRTIGKLAVVAYEVIDGSRHVSQLGSWFTVSAASRLREYRALTVERRSLYRDYRRAVPTVHRVHVTSPAPGVVEASVTLNTPGRTKVAALRLEAPRGKWRAASVDVLH